MVRVRATVRDVLGRLAVCALIALAGAGCGSVGSPPPQTDSVAVVPTPAPGGDTAPPASTTTVPAIKTTYTGPTPTTTTTTTTAPTTTIYTSPEQFVTTPTTNLPPAPEGLRPAAGYGSYDDCKGTCTGAVPTTLRRPLELPSTGAGASCPVSAGAQVLGYAAPAVGAGPIYAGQGSPLSISAFVDSAWDGGRVTWLETGPYKGPVLIRGGQVGGAESVGFGEGHVPDDELQLLNPVTTFAEVRQWPSFTRVQGPGCYAYQIDGTNFTEVIVFQASE